MIKIKKMNLLEIELRKGNNANFVLAEIDEEISAVFIEDIGKTLLTRKKWVGIRDVKTRRYDTYPLDCVKFYFLITSKNNNNNKRKKVKK